jgi:hypothetical protein
VTELATYTVDRLWEDEEFVLSRRVSNDKQVSLLVSMPASAQPTVETLTPLGHAYVLRDKFDSTWAARPVALERPDGRSAPDRGPGRRSACANDLGSLRI